MLLTTSVFQLFSRGSVSFGFLFAPPAATDTSHMSQKNANVSLKDVLGQKQLRAISFVSVDSMFVLFSSRLLQTSQATVVLYSVLYNKTTRTTRQVNILGYQLNVGNTETTICIILICKTINHLYLFKNNFSIILYSNELSNVLSKWPFFLGLTTSVISVCEAKLKWK